MVGVGGSLFPQILGCFVVHRLDGGSRVLYRDTYVARWDEEAEVSSGKTLVPELEETFRNFEEIARVPVR